jgi:hypothetical protein
LQSDDLKRTSVMDDPAPAERSRKADAMDFAYLTAQTFGDDELEGELLDLFLDQARRLVPSLPHRDLRERVDMAHLLKGSARAIGAVLMATAIEAYELTDANAQTEDGSAYAAIVTAFQETEVAIVAHRTRRTCGPA